MDRIVTPTTKIAIAAVRVWTSLSPAHTPTTLLLRRYGEARRAVIQPGWRGHCNNTAARSSRNLGCDLRGANHGELGQVAVELHCCRPIECATVDRDNRSNRTAGRGEAID